ncbi:hypothetical protein VTN02DRAFT_2306 [Thermoascus thermophilus]
MAEIKSLNAHDRPPDVIRDCYKKYQRLPLAEVDGDPDIVNLQDLDPENLPESIALAGWMSSEELRPAFDRFVVRGDSSPLQHAGDLIDSIPIFTHRCVSGLRLIPSLFPPAIQAELLSRLFHRDLSNPNHQTNVHLHYNVSYPARRNATDMGSCDTLNSLHSTGCQASFFEDDPARVLSPKNPEVHKPITIQNLLDKKLRWITLGGQYDWTAKQYPAGPPPPFPQDIADLLRAAFPETEAQAAIVNVYTAGDTLSMHRDVSEECDVGLISVSFGCDGLFLVGHDNADGCEVIRLRSGDAVYMTGRSRFAWHGVPKVLPSTCPIWLKDWPAYQGGGAQYRHWRGWMSSKRINLNVRQMTSSDNC